MRRWTYVPLTIAMLVGAVLLEHAPAKGADAIPIGPGDEQAAAAQAQQEASEFVPTEKLPADAIISFPVDI
jgi:hypothetical protein